MMLLSKPLLRRRHKKCFWDNRDICTNLWNCKFLHIISDWTWHDSLRILRIEMQLRMRKTS